MLLCAVAAARVDPDEDRVLTRLRLVDGKPTSTGVLILTYEPDRSKPA